MKYVLIVPLIFLAGCSYLAARVSSVADDPAKVKERVMKVVQGQREKKDWMKTDFCPADKIPEATRRPKGTAADCARNPESCLNHCDAGEGDSCYSLARLIQDNDTVQNDVADILYRHACRLGIVSGCTNSASNLFERHDDAAAVTCAARTFEVGCAREDPWACTMNGLALAEGIGRAKNVPEALRSLDRACEVSIQKNGEACTKAKELKAATARSGN